MKKISEKFYEHFSTQERVNLTIAAFLRDDQAEIERLKRSCPRKNYQMIDLNYQTPVRGFLHHYLSFSSLFQSYYTELRVCETTILIGQALVFGYEAGFELASPELSSFALEEKQAEYQKAFSRQEIKRKSLIANLKAIYEGYLFVCEKLKFNLADVSHYWIKNLSVFCPKLETYLHESTEANLALLEEIKRVYENQVF